MDTGKHMDPDGEGLASGEQGLGCLASEAARGSAPLVSAEKRQKTPAPLWCARPLPSPTSTANTEQTELSAWRAQKEVIVSIIRGIYFHGMHSETE